MNSFKRGIWTAPCVLVGWLMVTGVPEAGAQPQPGRGANRRERARREGTSPAELQRLFDAYALVQVQDVLRLTPAQSPEFIVRFRALQEARRHAQQARFQLVQELRQLADRARTDASTRDPITERIRALKELESRGLADILQALEKLDEVLDPIQQARLRVVEEQMERRKLELLVRARQTARARRQRP